MLCKVLNTRIYYLTTSSLQALYYKLYERLGNALLHQQKISAAKNAFLEAGHWFQYSDLDMRQKHITLRRITEKIQKLELLIESK